MKAEDLKNSILQLAMEGKLVPQDPNDEPASVLLDKIREKKEQLIKDKKIKRNNKESFIFRKNGHVYEKIGKNDEPVCIDDEIPFDIPDSWEWVRINTIREVYTGNSINKTEKETKFTGLNEGYNYIATKDVKFDNSIDYDNGVKIPRDLEKFRVASQGSVLLCIEGGSAGRKIGILNQDVCFGNKLACFKTFNENNDFLSYYLQSPNFKEIFKSKKTGIIGGVGIAKLRNVLMPIPPYNEQKRIINKLRVLFPKINEYGFNEEKLDKLNSEFPDSSILQEAIQGKLVPQDSNDEPASVLLEKIKEEKGRLIKEKKIKRNKNESIIYNKNNHYYEIIGKKGKIHCIDDEIPFDIPNNWNWVKLNNICNYGNFLSIDSKNIADNDWVLDLKDIEKDTGKLINFTVKKEIKSKSKKFIFKRGDVLYSKLRPYLNKVIIAKQDGYCTTEILPLKFYNSVYNYYAQIVLMSPYFVNYAIECSYGTKMPRLGTSDGKNAFFPLPPSNEQIKIVNKVKECFNIIDSFNK